MTLKSIVLGLLLCTSFANSQQPTPAVNKVALEELSCLTKNIFYEAGNQSLDGKLAVAYVTHNRTKDSRFPMTICGVIKQRNQFSWVKNKSYQKAHRPSDTDWRWVESEFVAKNFLLYPDPTKGALFFHEVSLSPGWSPMAYQKVARVERHIFYKFKER